MSGDDEVPTREFSRFEVVDTKYAEVAADCRISDGLLKGMTTSGLDFDRELKAGRCGVTNCSFNDCGTLALRFGLGYMLTRGFDGGLKVTSE